MKEEKLIESSWNASDHRLCPGASSRAAPTREGFMESGRGANILPFHTPIKPRLNLSASQPLAPGVAVLSFSVLSFIYVVKGEDFERALCSLNRLNSLFTESLRSPSHTRTHACSAGVLCSHSFFPLSRKSR